MGRIFGNNISEKYKFQWVAPERTGSRKVAEILSYYGFTNQGKNVFYFGNYNYSHHYDPKLNKDFRIVCNCRNPYSRVLSLYKNFYQSPLIKNQVNFKRYLTEDLPKGKMLKLILNPTLESKPDYVIRLEKMTDDLLKLPFIYDVLSEKQIILLSSHPKKLEDWESHYDSESKEIVYNLIPNQFEYFGYQK